VHELKAEVMRRFKIPGERPTMLVTIITFGFKYSLPYNVDLLFDVRFLPNPHWVPELRPFPGTDPAVRDYVRGSEVYRAYLDRLEALLDVSLPGYVAEGKSYLTIGIGCTGGRHRSVRIAERLRPALAHLGVARVRVRHRDLGRT
jgi:UPF0042 nucleotide-binding protein